MYNYREAIKDDIRTYINDNNITITSNNSDEMYERLNDDLWIDDSVTGNGSGSYTFSRIAAKECVAGNSDIIRKMVKEWGIPAKEIAERFIDEDYEWFDVSIRCYLLGECLYDVIADIIAR